MLLINRKAAILDPNTSQIKPIGSDLTHTRSWHTATLLPDATVLIVGGIDPSGNVIADPEIFDPETQTFEPVLNAGLSARAYHSATLLTDGTVLLAGGISVAGTPVSSADIWDFRTRAGKKLEGEMLSPRVRPIARLLSDGSVLLSGGVQGADPSRIRAEVYSPSSRVFQPSYAEPRLPRAPMVEGSVPENRATDVATDAVVGVRFSSRMEPDSLNAATVVLLDSSLTHHDAQIVTAEQGMLLFVAPKSPLAPSTRYILAVNGAKDLPGNPISYTTLTFTTATAAPLQENRLITTPHPSASTHVRASIAPAADPPDPANTKSIKDFVNCLNMTLVADKKAHNVADTVRACIPGQAAQNMPICQFQITMSDQSAQAACILKNKTGQPVQFPRVILDCPGQNAPFRFRPSYTLCPGTQDQQQLDHIELGYDLGAVTFATGAVVNPGGNSNPNGGTMMMGDITVPRDKPLDKLVFGPGKGAIVSFYRFVGDDLGNIQSCAGCHVATFAVAQKNVNTVVPYPPLNPFDQKFRFGAFTHNLASLVISTNSDKNTYPGADKAPASAQNSTKPFKDVCDAIKANINNMTGINIVAPATMMVASQLCQNLFKVVDLGK